MEMSTADRNIDVTVRSNGQVVDDLIEEIGGLDVEPAPKPHIVINVEGASYESTKGDDNDVSKDNSSKKQRWVRAKTILSDRKNAEQHLLDYLSSNEERDKTCPEKEELLDGLITKEAGDETFGSPVEEFIDELIINVIQELRKRNDSVARFVNELIEKDEDSCYCCLGAGRTFFVRLVKELLGPTYSYKLACECNESVPREKDIRKHLMFWSLLFNKVGWAEYLLNKTEDDFIAGAVVAGAMLKGLATKSGNDQSEMYKMYIKSSRKFENKAIEHLGECWKADRSKTGDMLIRVCHGWGHITVLGMAYSGNLEDFIHHTACNTKLENIWRGDISLNTSLSRIVFCAVVLPAAFILRFVRHTDNDTRLDERPKIAEQNKRNIMSLRVTPFGSGISISYINAIYRTWRAPVVKCVHYMIYFFGFLTVFSIFLMTELRPFPGFNVTCAKPNLSDVINSTNHSDGLNTSDSTQCCLGIVPGLGCWELGTYLLIISNLFDEIRQMLRNGGKSLGEWASDGWNMIDATSYVFAAGAVVARLLTPVEHFEIVYWLFSMALVINFIRFYQLFYVVKSLGPKIIMIREMMEDLMSFMAIVLMAMLAFGVINIAILEPTTTLDRSIVSKIFYKPYYQMYGELFLEEGYSQGSIKWLLLAAYMVITNVLLLNLLIAMFSHTFEKVQEKATKLWSFNYYGIIYEHFDRPRPPLIGPIFQIFKDQYHGRNKQTPFRKNFRIQGSLCCPRKNEAGEDHDTAITEFVKDTKYFVKKRGVVKLIMAGTTHKSDQGI